MRRAEPPPTMRVTATAIGRRALAAGLTGLLAACGSAHAPAAAPVAPSVPSLPAASSGVSLVARLDHSGVGIYPRPGAAHPALTLSTPNPYGFLRVLLVKRAVPGWLDVYLPMRPNGATGWVRRSDVSVARDPYLLRIDLRRHRLTLLLRGVVVERAKVGVGVAVTPTPSGVYFVTELFRLTDPSGPYGPYGFGLSAYSNVLHEFAGADGQIGIHGTNDPGAVGTDVSHGCIRLTNPEITRLARLLPLGTRVDINRA